MKKILILAPLLMAIASYGGTALVANAQTAQSMTPAQTAALQQQLDDAKAQLIQLEMQAGTVPQGDAGLPTSPAATNVAAPVAVTAPEATMTLSASDIASISVALSSLRTALVSIESEISANPQIVALHGQGIISVLQGMGTTLASIDSEVAGSNVAMTSPSTGSANAGSGVGTGIAQANPSAPTAATAPVTAPSAAATTPATPPPATANTAPTTAPSPSIVPQVAQASSGFSFSKLNWPLIVVIILIVAAIAIWLWWDDGDDTKKQPAVRTNSSSPNPQRPIQQPLQASNQSSAPMPMNSSSSPTPLSAAVGQQQKKTA